MSYCDNCDSICAVHCPLLGEGLPQDSVIAAQERDFFSGQHAADRWNERFSDYSEDCGYCAYCGYPKNDPNYDYCSWECSEADSY